MKDFGVEPAEQAGQKAVAPSDVLDRAACLQSLRTVALGRVAWTSESGHVTVEPVNFVLDGESVIFRTAEGEKLDALRQGRPFSFEADDVEPALRVGWSVQVTGSAEVVSDAKDLRRLRDLALTPWDQSGPKPYFVRIEAEHMTGRRLPLHPGGVTFVHRHTGKWP